MTWLRRRSTRGDPLDCLVFRDPGNMVVQGAATRAVWNDSALVRWLARLGGTGQAASPRHFADQLGDWLKWTDAMPLLTAMEGELPPTLGVLPCSSESIEAERTASQQLHTRLAQAITGDSTWAPAPPPPRPTRGRTPSPHVAHLLPMDMPADFTPYRLRYQARQHGMETGIAPQRARLRSLLTGCGPALARLGAVDAVMDQVLAEPERRLLATVPNLLDRRFRQLRDEAMARARTAAGPGAEPDKAELARIAAGGPWLDTFHQEIQSVLLAELELRWAPLEGLLSALRSAPSSTSSSSAPAGAALPP